MNELDDIEALAAEYVLGTLDAAGRADVAARMAREPALAAAVAAWAARLAPLDAGTRGVVPPPGVYPRIERRIDALARGNAAAPDAGVVSLLEARVRRWRTVAAAASALAACLTLAIGLRETMLAPKPQSFVAVFHRDDELPAFLMTIDLSTRQLTVRPVGASRQPGRTYQLWIASDLLGPAPRSLGLIGEGAEPAQASLTAYDPALLHKATFGVSLEPAGGSPTGRPSAGALHAKLYPATP